jgi:hypothetical protein
MEDLMARKAIAPHISEASAEFYAENFSTLHAGTTYALDLFPALYRRTLQDLKGIFIEPELMLMIDVFNATALMPQLAGQHLEIQVADGIELDGLDEKWKVDKKSILKKIETLPIFSAACIEIWANGFWYANEEAQKDLDGKQFKTWVKQLL